ncbi:VOC family protein [Kaistia algarum]|uniref:VOC family protein n=1 Tax=Kaistia algarum TaxID=2083279 RepID=UPI000CE82C00|nr:VOC family protein [Kaistia algarum]MCX5513809.1 VOC family protein [Kaistia algarum]PPE79327.1 VOC family protein [Kaistia algarum]
MAEPGTFYWNELMTRDAARAKDFYAKTLGWTFDSMPMGEAGDYHIAKVGDTMVGGIMELSGAQFEGVPDNWFSYIAVDDLDQRLALLKENGGMVIREPFDVPGVGRIAIIAIPGGAAQGWMVPVPM